MPNYIVLNSKFKPFSFEEILRPALLATQEHQALDQAYSELNQQAAPWENRINQLRDPISYSMYNEFSNKLLSNVEQLAKEGLNSGSRRALFQTNADYKNKIVPIENAYNSRIEDLKKQRDLLEKDSTAMFSLDIGSTSVDDYLRGNRPQYNTVYGSEILKRSSDLFDNFKNQLTNVSNWQETAQGRLLERIETKGFTRQDLVDILNNPESYPDITYLMKNILSSSGVDYLSLRDQQKAYQFLIEGMASGLGTSNIDTRVNPNSLRARGSGNQTPAIDSANFVNATYVGPNYKKDAKLAGIASEEAELNNSRAATNAWAKYPEYRNFTKDQYVKTLLLLNKELEELEASGDLILPEYQTLGDKVFNSTIKDGGTNADTERYYELSNRAQALHEMYAKNFEGYGELYRAYEKNYDTLKEDPNFTIQSFTSDPKKVIENGVIDERLIDYTPGGSTQGNKVRQLLVNNFITSMTGKNIESAGIIELDENYNSKREIKSLKQMIGSNNIKDIEDKVVGFTSATSNLGPDYTLMTINQGDKIKKFAVPNTMLSIDGLNNIIYGGEDNLVTGTQLWNEASSAGSLDDMSTLQETNESIVFTDLYNRID